MGSNEALQERIKKKKNKRKKLGVHNEHSIRQPLKCNQDKMQMYLNATLSSGKVKIIVTAQTVHSIDKNGDDKIALRQELEKM